jgi:hypothetical protein
MSLMSMRRKMASQQTATIILWVLIAVFLVGVLLWSVPPTPPGDNPTGGSGTNKTIAKVNGVAIMSRALEEEFAKQSQQPGMSVDLTSALSMRQETFNKLVERQLLKETLKKLHVSSNYFTLRDMAKEYAQTQLLEMHESAETKAKEPAPAEKKDGKPAKPKSVDELYAQEMAEFMKAQGGKEIKSPTEQQFTRWMVNDFLLNTVKEQYTEFAQKAAIGDALMQGLAASPTSEEFVKALNTKEVKARWIFITAEKPTKAAVDAAQKKANEVHAQISKAPASFADIAKKESKDFMTSSNGGDLGWIQSGKSYGIPLMAEYLAFSQKKGELGPVIQVNNKSYMGAQVGFAFLKVEDVRDLKDLPKDFNWDKKKASALARTKQRFQLELGSGHLEYARYAAVVDAISPEIAVYQAEALGEYIKADEFRAKAMTEKDLPLVVQAAIKYRVAMSAPDQEKRIILIREALPFAGTKVSQLHMELGRALAATGKKDEALEQYRNAAEISKAQADKSTVEGLKTEFKTLGATAEAQDLAVWLKEQEKKAPAAPPQQ